MAQLNDVDTSTANDLMDEFPPPAPPGDDYVLAVTESERKPNAKQTGEYLNATIEIVEGQYQGRKIFHNFNFWNPNQQAVEIAKSEFRALCEATVGVPKVNDSAQIHFKKFLGSLDVEEYENKNGKKVARNVLIFRKGKIRAMGAAAPQAQPAALPSAAAIMPQKATASSARPPWAK